jgi:carbonic anhydrase
MCYCKLLSANSFIAATSQLEEEANENLEGVIGGLPAVLKGSSTTLIPGDSMAWLHPFLQQHGRYFTYQGSLTTPPCSEAVTWINLRKTSEVSEEQVIPSLYKQSTGVYGPA